MGDVQFNGTPEEWEALVKKNKEQEEPYDRTYQPIILSDIDKEEPKQETLDEGAEKYAEGKSSNSTFRNTHIRDLTIEEAAEKWVFETNGHKWSNNDDTAGDNYGSFKAGAKWQAERMYSEEEAIQLLIKFNQEIQEVENVRDWFEQFKKK
jgi:hypothetical protein